MTDRTSDNHQPSNQPPKKPHFYDVSFDVTEDEHQPDAQQSHTAQPKSSKWDHFYEKYAQEQEKKYATQYIKHAHLNASQKESATDEPVEVESEQGDEWTFRPENSKTIMGTSSQLLHKYYGHAKQFFQGLGDRTIDENPYKAEKELTDSSSKYIDEHAVDQAVANLTKTAQQMKQKVNESSGIPHSISKNIPSVHQADTPQDSRQQEHALSQSYAADQGPSDTVQIDNPRPPFDKIATEPKGAGLKSEPTQTTQTPEVPVVRRSTSMGNKEPLQADDLSTTAKPQIKESLPQAKTSMHKSKLDLTESGLHTDADTPLVAQPSPLIKDSAKVTEPSPQPSANPLHQSVTTQTPRRSFNSDLPSPDEIAAERERRRKLRIEQLEKLTSLEEVEQSHFSQPASTPATYRQPDYQTTAHPSKAINNELTQTQQASNQVATPQSKVQTITTDLTEAHKQVPAVVDLGQTVSIPLNQLDDTADHSEVENTPDTDAMREVERPLPQATSSYLPEVEASTTAEQIDHTELNKPFDTDALSTQESETQASTSAALDDDLEIEDTPTSEPSSNIPDLNDEADADSHATLEANELPTDSKSTRQTKHKARTTSNQFDLSSFTTQEKVVFGFNVFLNILKKFVYFGLIFLCLGGALAAGAGVGYFANLVAKTEPPTQEEMAAKINQLEQLSTIYYADGSQIANIKADVVRSKTDLSDISQYIIDGLISVEDEYFYEHHGVMPKAILRAVIQEVIHPGSGTGGSTLTQQLVKQRLLSNEVTFFRKANEILLALRLENYFSKDEILTAYLNVSPFGRNNNGENVAGIAKASEGIFGKSPAEVNLAQAAFLVGLPQNPYTYTPYDQTGQLREDVSAGVERMKTVLYSMYRNKKISQADYEAALNYDITKDFLPTAQKSEERQTYLYQAMMNGAIEQIMALRIQEDGFNWDQVYNDDDWYNEYYFAAEQELQTGGYKIFTTIDKQIYDQMNTSAKANIDNLGPKYEGVYTDTATGQETSYLESAQAGVVLIENTSGRVLGFVSGTDYDTNQIDHAFKVRRSPGSTIKPLAVYGPALEMNIITPATQIANTAFSKTYEDGTEWTPTNYGNVVPGGNESARIALQKSDNIPAVRIYEALQKKQVNVHNYLVKMGFNDASYPQTDVQNLAFSIGGVSTGPTVFEQTRAFSTIANQGNYIDGYYIAKIEDANGQVIFEHKAQPVNVFSEDSNYLLIDMLRDVMTQGTATTAHSLLTMGGDWIAKTGTSENSKDVWLVAATPKLTIGSWIGYDNRFSNHTIDRNDGFGPEGERSQRFTAQILTDLYAIRPEIFGVDQVFTQPNSVIQTTVLQQTGTLPGSVTTPFGHFTLMAPTYQELFKVTPSAPQLVYDFILGANDDDLAIFWNTVYTQYLNQKESSHSGEESNKPSEPENETTTATDTSSNP